MPINDSAPNRAPYIREQFQAFHLIDPADDPDMELRRIRQRTSGRQVDPDILTVVTKTSLCELAGFTYSQFNGWKEHGHGAGKPPEGRWYGDRGKPGSPIMWYFERDIMPWLEQTEFGRAALRRMVTDIQRGDLYPDYEVVGRSKILRGYLQAPKPEHWPRVGRRKKAAV